MKNTGILKNLARENAVLNPIDRISEVLFGLIMVLTFTSAISVSTSGKQEISELLWAALGCNLAWALVDVIMFLLNVLLERGHSLKALREIKQTKTDEESAEILKEEIQPLIHSLLTKEELLKLAARVKAIPSTDERMILTSRDYVAGFQIFILVFLCTFPIALPFAILEDVQVAIRTSNGIALLLLFIGGYKLAGYAGFRPLFTALIYTIIGVLLVGMTIALGG
ncbi:MAG: VIT1/CCC1 transporter family protein [Algoriphagus sp.]|nr:VIT1/CCC1 transporter family protein [Algoriphagus sp.]